MAKFTGSLATCSTSTVSAGPRVVPGRQRLAACRVAIDQGARATPCGSRSRVPRGCPPRRRARFMPSTSNRCRSPLALASRPGASLPPESGRLAVHSGAHDLGATRQGRPRDSTDRAPAHRREGATRRRRGQQGGWMRVPDSWLSFPWLARRRARHIEASSMAEAARSPERTAPSNSGCVGDMLTGETHAPDALRQRRATVRNPSRQPRRPSAAGERVAAPSVSGNAAHLAPGGGSDCARRCQAQGARTRLSSRAVESRGAGTVDEGLETRCTRRCPGDAGGRDARAVYPSTSQAAARPLPKTALRRRGRPSPGV